MRICVVAAASLVSTSSLGGQPVDSFNNPTYGNGSAGALYGQYAPLVNVSRPPKEWQSYDIVFHTPKCGPDRRLATPGTVTVLYNGVLVQDNVTVRGRTTSSDNTDVCEDVGPPAPIANRDEEDRGERRC